MGRRHHGRPPPSSSSSFAASSTDDDLSPPSSAASSDDSLSRSRRRLRHGRRPPPSESSTDDSEGDSSESSEDEQPRRNRRRRRKHAVAVHHHHGRRDRDSDEESLIGAGTHHQHHSKRKHHHGGGGAGRRGEDDDDSPPPSNNGPLLLGGVLLLLLLLGGGGYWLYQRNSAASSSSDDSSSSGSTASTATGSSGGSAGSNTGAGTTKAASTGAAGTGGSGGSSAGTGGGSTKTSADAGGESTGTATGSAAAASGTGGASSGSGGTGNIGGFWENWVGQSVADTDFSPYTHAYWFTAVPGTAEEKGALTMGEASDGQAKEWVTAAQSAGCKAMLTVGGWSGSSTFTKLVATDTSRSDFVDTLSTALDDYGFDGIDIDWEYPGAAGATNDFDSADLDNLLTFLKLLRDKIGTDKLISADTSASVWVGADGTASTDLSAFGEVLDWILIMEYDTVNGNSANTGPNFPYDSSCAPGGSTFATPTTTQAWIDAKFPAEKISIGLASYGYAWKVSDVVDGGGVSGASSTIYQTVSEKLDTDEQTVVWDDIGTTYASSTTTLDDCTSTPYLYSSDTQIFVAFDNEESIKKKGSFAGDNGLWGCGLYASLTQDKSGTLAKAAKEVC